MYSLIQKWLFSKDAEWSHDFTLSQLQRFAHTPLAFAWRQQLPLKPVRVMGIDFPNLVGLAAGLDKNAACIDAFAQMGFGFIEVGTVTPKPQPGNPKPRMFRLPEKRALINRMGFNNGGVEALIENVKKSSFKGVLGINIGKNKDTAEADAVADYAACMRAVYPYASYITINISSPNTPGLRNLQHGDALTELLRELKTLQAELSQTHQKYVPLAVKIAPDLTDDELRTMADALLAAQIDAVIATNTTLDRSEVTGLPHADEAGGLSGAILQQRSTEIVRKLYAVLRDKVPIIAVGGISSAADMQAKLSAGAKLVQIYTGFIYQGPKLVRDLVESL